MKRRRRVNCPSVGPYRGQGATGWGNPKNLLISNKFLCENIDNLKEIFALFIAQQDDDDLVVRKDANLC